MTKPDLLRSPPDGLLLLPHLSVHNANAISGPLTWGFPSPSAFLGFAHALERQLALELPIRFSGVGIVCHHFEAQTFQPNRRRHLVFNQSRNPVYLKKDAAKFIAEGTPPAIIEEGRAHFEVSLVLAAHTQFCGGSQQKTAIKRSLEALASMRLAGGSLLPWRLPKRYSAESELWFGWPGDQKGQREQFKKLCRHLLPGFALVHRPDLLQLRLQQLQAEQAEAHALDALLDLCSLKHAPSKTSAPADEKVAWHLEKRPAEFSGWLVPMPIGFAGISPLYDPGTVAAARDTNTPFRFVESLYSLGQWISPHRFNSLQQLLWQQSADAENGLYRCENQFSPLNQGV